jgi:Branched-chain amino acid transport system / permease component
VSLGWNRLWAFTLAGLTAGAAGILYTSRLGGATANIDNNLVLFAVASAVIGGVSLFGGRGKMVHALLGRLVIAVIYNGMGLIARRSDPGHRDRVRPPRCGERRGGLAAPAGTSLTEGFDRRAPRSSRTRGRQPGRARRGARV